MKSLREAVYQYVVIQENVQRYVSRSNNLSVKGQQFVSKHITNNYSVSHRSDVLAVNSQRSRGHSGNSSTKPVEGLS